MMWRQVAGWSIVLFAACASSCAPKGFQDQALVTSVRILASSADELPVGILYRNPDVPCYEDLRRAGQARPVERIRGCLEAELDKVTVWPADDAGSAA